ncbi:MAG TPA: alpha/beta hydrolase [Actinomycetota bacterium]|nr:alpha/beta hydrolase [Actinomycetota bacterium]
MIDDRPIVLLLPDEGRGPEQWRDFVPLLESRFRTLSPVLAPGDRDRQLAQVREALAGERCAVIGHGAGGALALALAADGAVAAMVLLDSPIAEDVDRRALAMIDVPVLLLWGEDDAEVPVSVAEELNEAIPTSTLGVLPGCGHDLTDVAAATIAPMILEYLRARYLGSSHADAHAGAHGHARDGVVRIQLERRPPWVDLADDERDDWFVDEEQDG